MEIKTIIYIIGFILYLYFTYRKGAKKRQAKKEQDRPRQVRPAPQPTSPQTEEPKNKEWESWLEDMLPEDWKQELEAEKRKQERKNEPTPAMEPVPLEVTDKYVNPYKSLSAENDAMFSSYSGAEAASAANKRTKESAKTHSILHAQPKKQEIEVIHEGPQRIRLTAENAREAIILSEILRRPEY